MQRSPLHPARTLRMFAGALLTGALVLGLTGPAGADDLDDRLAAAQKKANASSSHIAALKDELAETDRQLADAYVVLRKAQEQLPVAEAALAVAQKNFDIAQREADALASKLQDARDERAALEAAIEDNDSAMAAARSGVVEMGRQAARGDMDMSGIGMIVGAESSDEFIERYNMNTTALRTQGNSLNQLRQTQAISRNAQARLDAVNTAIEELKEQADQKLVEANEKKQIAADAKVAVEGLITQKAQAANVIEGHRASTQANLQDEQAQRAAVSDESLGIIGMQEVERKKQAEADRKRDEQAKKDALEQAKKDEAAREEAASKPGSNPPPKPPSSGGDVPSGGAGGGSGSNKAGWFVWPTQYRVLTSPYGYRLHPIFNYVRLHAGADMRAYCGSQLYAARGGTVVSAKFRAGLGNQVLINHGTIDGSNIMSSYNHMTSFAVSAGQQVSAGQLIGLAVTTGSSSACHLHFEVYQNGSTIDPMPKMK